MSFPKISLAHTPSLNKTEYVLGISSKFWLDEFSMNRSSSCPTNFPIRVKLSVHDKILFKSTMDTLVDYTNPLLDSYRSSSHDAILVYGFIPERASSGAFKTSFTLQDGLKYKKDY